jgi:hypothetical protein
MTAAAKGISARLAALSILAKVLVKPQGDAVSSNFAFPIQSLAMSALNSKN